MIATRAENLTTALNQIATQLADLTAAPKPSYSVNGRSISWGEHFAALTARYEEIEKMLQRADGPFELRSTVRT